METTGPFPCVETHMSFAGSFDTNCRKRETELSDRWIIAHMWKIMHCIAHVAMLFFVEIHKSEQMQLTVSGTQLHMRCNVWCMILFVKLSYYAQVSFHILVLDRLYFSRCLFWNLLNMTQLLVPKSPYLWKKLGGMRLWIGTSTFNGYWSRWQWDQMAIRSIKSLLDQMAIEPKGYSTR